MFAVTLLSGKSVVVCLEVNWSARFLILLGVWYLWALSLAILCHLFMWDLALGVFSFSKTGKLPSLHRLLRPFVHLTLFKILYFLEHLPITEMWMVDHVLRGCKIANQVSRCDFPSLIALIWACIMQLILGLSRITQNPWTEMTEIYTI